jgi:hypothetical protein
MIKITKTSIISGTTRTIELPITQDQLERWQRGEDLIQNIMPDLTPEQREFVMTGVTSEEWDDTFKDEDV